MGLFLALGLQNIFNSCLIIIIDVANNNAVLIDGKLYHISLKNNVELRRKVVVGQKEANQIFLELHASPYGAHCGTERTKLAISARFYWPGMGVDIDKWVNIKLFLSTFPWDTNGLCFRIAFLMCFFLNIRFCSVPSASLVGRPSNRSPSTSQYVYVSLFTGIQRECHRIWSQNLNVFVVLF